MTLQNAVTSDSGSPVSNSAAAAGNRAYHRRPMTRELLGSIGLGAGLAFGAAIQPGPLQAFLLSRVAASGPRRTLPAVLAPLLSDGPIALVAVVLVGRIPPAAQQLLQAAGGLLLLHFAWSAARQWRCGSVEAARVDAPRTILQAALVNLLNPNPYLAWALVLGPAVVAAWNRHPADALGFVLAFYGTMVVTLASFVLLAGTAGALDARARRLLLGLSALLLAALGALLLVLATFRLAAAFAG